MWRWAGFAEILAHGLTLLDVERGELGDGAGCPQAEAAWRASAVIEVDDVCRAGIT